MDKGMNLSVCVSGLLDFVHFMTAAHEEIATGGQIRGACESDKQTLSK